MQGTLVLGNPPSAGPQVINLVYQELQPSARAGAPPTWETKTTVNQPITVLSAPQYVPRAPYDLVYESVDDNGFPLNPRWGKQDWYFFDRASHNLPNPRDLWEPPARPDILKHCYDHAEHQDFNGINNDYDAFRNGFCKHSPGVSNSALNPFYCQGDKEVDGYQPGGPIYCASFAWKDTPWAGKCLGLSGNMNDIMGDGGFLITFHNSGHENFRVVTYDGIVNWDNAQAEWNGDSDWCINLYTQHGAGVTGRKDGVQVPDMESFVHTEFDPHNLGDDWDRGFWGQLRNAIHANQQGFGAGSCLDIRGCQGTTDNENRNVAWMINGRRAIVIGLLGLDLGHNDAQSELHPVYGMAIHTGGTYDETSRTLNKGGRPRAGSACQWDGQGHCNIDADAYLHPERDSQFDVPLNLDDDIWAIFATNFGNEGYCSTRALHVLDGDQSVIGLQSFPTMTFRIPWAKDKYGQDMKDVEILFPQTNFVQHAQADIGQNQENWDYAIDKGDRKGVIVTFHLYPSAARPNWFGELHLKWTPALAPTMTAHAPSRGALQSQVRSAHPLVPTTIEQHLSTSGMTAAQSHAFTTEMMKKPQTPAPIVPKVIVGIPNRVPPPPPPSLRSVPQIAPRDPAKVVLSPGAAEEDAAIRRALCAAYEGHVPNLPADFCQQSPH
jgi:hypothetical protein